MGVASSTCCHHLSGRSWPGYVSLDVEATWAALERVIALFRQVAPDVGNALGYPYPQQVDDQVSTYLEAIREMPLP